MEPIDELVQLLARLPGVGERTAGRHAFHILGEDPSYAARLGEALRTLHDRVRRCDRCGNYTSRATCAICEDPRRDAHVLCVVGHVQDLIAIERSGTFRGVYHVLHGLLAPLEGMGPEQLPLQALVERIDTQQVREVVIATPLHVDGEATALYVAQVMRPLNVRVSRIASGIPHGGELEFTDRVTLGLALQARREI
jgi:recombination protein RecR